MQPPSRPLARSSSAGSTYNGAPQTPNQQQNSRANQFNGGQVNGAQNQANQQGQRAPTQPFYQNRPPQQHNGNSSFSNTHVNNSGNNHSSGSGSTTRGTNPSGSSNQTEQQMLNKGALGAGVALAPGGEAVGFFSAKAVKDIPEESLATGVALAPQAGQVFNPRAESPSIRKTPGIDHTKSKPLARNGQHVAPPSSTQEARVGGIGASAGMSSRPAPQQQQTRPANVVNPQFDAARRIGAPGGPGSPLANRGQYRPPTIVNKRPMDGNLPGMAQGRMALADVSNHASGGTAVDGISGPEVKRVKMG